MNKTMKLNKQATVDNYDYDKLKNRFMDRDLS